jgi:hypothetical protein
VVVDSNLDSNSTIEGDNSTDSSIKIDETVIKRAKNQQLLNDIVVQQEIDEVKNKTEDKIAKDE